jgi:hypothetical protein
LSIPFLLDEKPTVVPVSSVGGAEVLDNHRRIFNRGDDLQGAAAVRAAFDVDIEDSF